MHRQTENILAEQAVLGSILLDGELIQECVLTPDHFSQVRHQRIFAAMRQVDESGEKIDVVAVTTALAGVVGEVGGATYLAELASSIPTTANFKSYERMVLDVYRIRKAKALMIEFAMAPDEKKLNEVYSKLSELQESNVAEAKSKQEILFEIAEDMNTPRGDITGINTGLQELNAMTGGLQAGELIIIAARPSMGKTAFALNLAMENCKNNGVTSIFSLEMGSKQLYHRMISAMKRIDGAKWKNPFKFLSHDDHRKVSQAFGVIENWDIYIYDQSSQTVFDIRAAVRKMIKDLPNRKHLVIIDYLQLMTPVGRFDRWDLAIGHITRELKNMAREFEIPVVLLSQLNRGVESRQDKRPMMSDIRDSGSVEQDADVIMFLYRDDYYNSQSEKKNIVELIIAKQRNGPVGSIELVFTKEYGLFLDLERRYAHA